MGNEKKYGMKILFITTPDGRTFEVDGNAEPVKWPENKKEDTAPKKYTATLSFKLDKKAVKRMNKYLRRSGFKRKKDYLRYKKWRRILIKNFVVIDRNRMKYSDPNFHKRMRQLRKYDKKIRRLIETKKRDKV